MSGAGAKTSRIRFPGKPFCAVPSKTYVVLRLPLDLAAVLAKLAAVLDKSRNSRSLEEHSKWVRVWHLPKWRTPKFSAAAVQKVKGSSNRASMPSCCAFHALIRVPWNYHRDVRKESAEGPDGSSHGVLPTATCGSSLWAPQNLTQSRRDGRKDSSARSSTATSPTTNSTTKGRRGKGAKPKDGEAY